MNLKKITSSIQKTIKSPIVTRFAPSSTGYLHLGHIASALFVWGFAKATNGKVILRIEDNDQQRSQSKYEKAIIEDLIWLGFKADLGCSLDSLDKKTSYRQSNKQNDYIKHYNTLKNMNLVYACKCTRKEIIKSMVFEDFIELNYNGTCKQHRLPFNDDNSIRCILEKKNIKFYDFVLGEQIQCPADQCGDLTIKDKHNNWTYQFAASIDDWEQQINLVIRGQDLTHTTARQLQLTELLGAKSHPFYLHHPLILKKNSHQKLSKKDFATSIRDRKKNGHTPEMLLGEAAFATGITSSSEAIHLDDLFKLF